MWCASFKVNIITEFLGLFDDTKLKVNDPIYKQLLIFILISNCNSC